jgi:hypothetical protein
LHPSKTGDEEPQVKKLGKCFLLLLMTVPVVNVYAQTPDELEAGFTLSLSMGMHSGEFGKTNRVMVATLTNISDKLIGDSWCSAFGGLYKLSVVYNGIQLREPDARRRHREDMEAGEQGRGCFGSNPGMRISHGEFMEDPIYYETDKPGTYEFTVERKAFLPPTGKSVTIQSNKLTIHVPEPEGTRTEGTPEGEKKPPFEMRLNLTPPLAGKSTRDAIDFALRVLQFSPSDCEPSDPVLLVTETNLPGGVVHENGCLPLTIPPAFNILVMHDGLPIKMDERRWVARSLKEAREHPALCNGVSWEEGAGPGGVIRIPLDLSDLYDLSKSGRYEVTLTEDAVAGDSTKSLTVKSNTACFTVPEPVTAKSQ